MKTLLQNPAGLLAALAMVAILLVLPQAAQAKVFLSDGTHPGGPGGGEGDPLDSNDYDGGGDDGDVHERGIIPRDTDVVLFESMQSSRMIILRVDYLDGVPVFSVYAVSASGRDAEASHVR